jgi:type I restriction enzyme, S subunit
MGKLYSFVRNNALSRDRLNYESGVAKNVHYGDIHTKFPALFDITKERVPYINSTEELPPDGSEDYCVEGDVILADASEDINDVGKSIEIVRLNSERLLSGQHTILARRNDNAIIVGFGGHLFRSGQVRLQIQKQAQGTKVYAITSKRLAQLDIAYPNDKKEQQKIAVCLTSLDKVIAAQGRKVEALKTHKRGLMQQLFPREGETVPRLRFPEFRDGPEWTIVRLGAVSDVRDGTHDSPEFVASGRPLVTSKNLRSDGTLNLENVSLISEYDYAQINRRSVVCVGDILFGMIGSIGNPVLLKTDGFAIKNVALIKELELLSNAFVVQLLQSEYVAAILAVLNTGNSQKFIALGKIRGLPIPIPSLLEQRRIADCLTSLDTRIAAETNQLAALKTHKRGLMQQLFPAPDATGA